MIAEADRCLFFAISLLETSLVLAEHTGDEAAWRNLDNLIEVSAIEVVAQDAEQARISNRQTSVAARAFETQS